MDKNKNKKQNTNSFEKLDAWQVSHELVLLVYKITKDFPPEEKYSLTSQIRRAAISVPANLAEGNQRKSSKEFIQFCYTSKASLAEVKYFLILSRDLNNITNQQFFKLESKTTTVLKLINGLIKYLKTNV